MATITGVVIIFLTIYFHGVSSNLFISSLETSLNLDYCTSVCEITLPLGSNKIVKSECCNRGCRFYGIAEMVSTNRIQPQPLEYNLSTEACHNSCFESYSDESDRMACNMGCDTMAKYQKKVFEFLTSEVAYISLMQLLATDEDLSLKAQAGEPMEVDEMDPALKEQLVLDLLKRNKLPEMRVRTLPLNKDAYREDWWKICPKRHEGVPRCLFASLLMLLFLMALWLTLSWEDRTPSLPLSAPPLPPKYSLLDNKV